MVRCLVNNTPRVVDSTQKTWSDVLATLDAEAAAAGLAVTAVRFDGVDQPTFRGHRIAHVALSAVEIIEVESLDPRRLLRSALGTARHSLAPLATGARRLAAVYRLPDIDSARTQLSVLVATIRTLTELTLASAAAAGTALTEVACQGESGADVLGAVGVALDALSQGHDASDWMAVAGVLEHDLAPALLRWEVVFDAMQDGCAA
jgi:hypothetical protein